jgi:hypothetical protein
LLADFIVTHSPDPRVTRALDAIVDRIMLGAVGAPCGACLQGADQDIQSLHRIGHFYFYSRMMSVAT